jgi:uncharacterized protein (DUF488 family)
MTLYSIGHSNAAIDFFLDLLKKREIKTLVDARSKPSSRYNPHFTREPLKLALAEQGIVYVYLGHKIGGRPEDAAFYLGNGQVDYERLAGADFYLEAVDRLLQLGAESRTAFMCAEADYKHCHRHWLITRTLLERGVDVLHLLHTGDSAAADPKEFQAAQLNLF